MEVFKKAKTQPFTHRNQNKNVDSMSAVISNVSENVQNTNTTQAPRNALPEQAGCGGSFILIPLKNISSSQSWLLI